jgi:hypothetical protein
MADLVLRQAQDERIKTLRRLALGLDVEVAD